MNVYMCAYKANLIYIHIYIYIYIYIFIEKRANLIVVLRLPNIHMTRSK